MSRIRHQPVAPTQVSERAARDVIDRHRHDDHQLIYVSTGVLAITTANGSWIATAERGVWVPAGIWHEHRFYGRTRFHTVGFTLDRSPLPDGEPVVIAIDALVRELIVACTELGARPPESRRIRAVLSDRLRRAAVQPLRLPRARDPRLAEACELVEHDLRRPRPLGELARAVGSSERTLTRLFRAEFGTTYPQWRTDIRVFQAMIHLADGATVTDTAHRCGWATASAFIDTFTRTMGDSPGRFRSTGHRR